MQKKTPEVKGFGRFGNFIICRTWCNKGFITYMHFGSLKHSRGCKNKTIFRPNLLAVSNLPVP
jgi:hypothetical protein